MSIIIWPFSVPVRALFKAWLVVLLLFWGLAGAQDKLPQIAVLPVQGDESLTPQQLQFITGQLTAELVKTRTFTVLDRGQMDFILKEQGFQQTGVCNSSECQVQMGQLLGVEYIVAGALVRFGNKHALRADYIDVASGRVAHSVDQDENGDLEDVYKELCLSVGQQLAQYVSAKNNKMAKIPAPAELAQGGASEPVYRIPPHVEPVPSKPLSVKRKVALALWGGSAVGAGAGWYFDGQGKAAAKDYDAAIDSQIKDDADNAFDRTESAELARDASYGVSVGAVVLGAALWFWPE